MTTLFSGSVVWPAAAFEESGFTIVAVLSLDLGVANPAILAS